MNKTLADFLNKIKISQNYKIKSFITRKNKKIILILNILQKLGYINNYQITKNNYIKIYLKYNKNIGAIRNIQIISKPSKRIYTKVKDHFKISKLIIFKTNGFLIYSTNKGIITQQESILLNTGGELLFKIW